MTLPPRKGMRKMWPVIILLALLLALVGVHAEEQNDTAPPRILMKSPQGATNVLPVTLAITTDEPASCRYSSRSAPYPGMEYDFGNTNQTHNATLNLLDGDYVYYVACKDLAENVGEPEQLAFTVDTQPPVITVVSPSGTVLTRSAELNVSTNEQASCKFDISDVSYPSMQSLFQATNARSHKHLLTGLAQGAYLYSVRCKDGAGNANPSSASVLFTVNQRPSASVTIDTEKESDDGTTLLKAGTYPVRVTSSEELAEIPQLRYNYNDDANMRTIALTGSGVSFAGYMIIPDDNTERVGSFSISLIDDSGLSGSDISSGKIFLIDTKKPGAPSAPEVEQARRGVKITWFEEEDAEQYKIYRSTISSVGKADYFTQVDGTEYTDTAVEDQKTYYYRVSAVDRAGNDGDLSPERFILVSLDKKTETAAEVKLSSSLQTLVKKKIADAEKASLDVDAVLLDLSMTTDPDKIAVIEYLNLVEKAKDAQAAIVETKSQLEGYLMLGLSESDVQDRLQKADLTIKKSMSGVTAKISIDEKADMLQPPESSAVYAATTEILQGMTPDVDERSAYESASLSLNEGARVSAEFLVVTLSSLDGTKKTSYAIVKKHIVLPSTLKKGMVVEIVPKEVAEQAGLIISKETPLIVKDDPMLKWTKAGVASFDLAYHVEGKRDLTAMKSTRTVILEDPSFKSVAPAQNNSQNNSITGLAAKPVVKDASGFGWQVIVLFVGVVCVIGLAVYYFFFMKSEESYEENASGEIAPEGSSRPKRKLKQRVVRSAAVQSAGPHAALLSLPPDRGQADGVLAGRPQVINAVLDLVDKASLHASQGDVGGRGQAFYLTALDLYNRLDEGQRRIVHPRLQDAYLQLAALDLVRQGHALVDARRYAELPRILARMSALQDELPVGVRSQVMRSTRYFGSCLSQGQKVSRREEPVFSPLQSSFR
jgi:hypothetical protein